MPAFIVTLRGKKMRRMESGEKRERERNKERVVEGDEWKSEREKERQGKRPQILFQVKGFLSRHLPCAREPVKIKMTSRNVFSLPLSLSLSLFSKLDKLERAPPPPPPPPPSTFSTSFFHHEQLLLDFTLIRARFTRPPAITGPRKRNRRAEVAALEAHRSRWMKITRLIRTGGKGRTEKGKGKRCEKKFRTDAFAMPYRSPSISGAPDRIDPTSGSGNGFSPGWRAEACRFDRGDRSRSGSCNENVNRCLDMLRTCVHPFGSADRSYSIVVPGPGVFQPPLCTLPRIYSRCVSSWGRETRRSNTSFPHTSFARTRSKPFLQELHQFLRPFTRSISINSIF